MHDVLMANTLGLQSIVFILCCKGVQVITTDKAHEAPMFSMGPGIATWRAATLSLGMLYVFINYAFKEERHWVHQTMILWDPRDVLQFCRDCSGNKSLKIFDISLLEPYRRGKVKTWRWTSVLNIRLYVEDDVEMPVYFTDAGEAVGLTREEAKQKMKSLYRAGPR